jgi:hypothetical protein
MFGKTVGKPCSPDTLRKMYTTFLEATTIKSKKKLHLARRTMPTVLEEMGYAQTSQRVPMLNTFLFLVSQWMRLMALAIGQATPVVRCMQPRFQSQ